MIAWIEFQNLLNLVKSEHKKTSHYIKLTKIKWNFFFQISNLSFYVCVCDILIFVKYFSLYLYLQSKWTNKNKTKPKKKVSISLSLIYILFTIVVFFIENEWWSIRQYEKKLLIHSIFKIKFYCFKYFSSFLNSFFVKKNKKDFEINFNIYF